MKPQLIALALTTVCCAHPTRIGRLPVDGDRYVTVKTYNLNFGLSGEAETLAAIGEGAPDLIFLQETSPEWEPHIRRAYSQQYPSMMFRHCCGAGGLAVLSKRPLIKKDLLEGPTGGWFPALRVIAESPIGRLQVLVVHLHPPATEQGNFLVGYFTTDAVREAEIKHFFAGLEPGLPTLIVGDLNEPDGDAVRFLQSQGLRTALPEFSPSAKTWRWKFSFGSISSRLDHIFYNALLEPLDVAVQEGGRSDHSPVVGVFERAAPALQKVEPQKSPGSLSFSP